MLKQQVLACPILKSNFVAQEVIVWEPLVVSGWICIRATRFGQSKPSVYRVKCENGPFLCCCWCILMLSCCSGMSPAFDLSLFCFFIPEVIMLSIPVRAAVSYRQLPSYCMSCPWNGLHRSHMLRPSSICSPSSGWLTVLPAYKDSACDSFSVKADVSKLWAL